MNNTFIHIELEITASDQDRWTYKDETRAVKKFGLVIPNEYFDAIDINRVYRELVNLAAIEHRDKVRQAEEAAEETEADESE